MPKIAENKSSLVQVWIKPYPDLVAIKDRIFCKSCNKTISSEKKYNIQQHMHTSTHQANCKGRQKQQSLQEFTPTAAITDSFNYKLCKVWLGANIPLKKLNNPGIKEFFKTQCNRDIPDESLLRKKYVDVIYTQTLADIKKIIGDNFIWFTVDETTDVCGRYIANLLIGTLHANAKTTAFLIKSTELHATNNITISRFVNDGLTNFYLPKAIPHQKVLLMLSDAAPYMIKAGKNLKIFFPNIIHCTCLAHGLNRVAETVREQFPLVNDLIKNCKKAFLKAPLRVQLYKEKLPGVPLPPQPVITRWGSWLEAANFYVEYYTVIKEIIFELEPEAAYAIKECQTILKRKELPQQLTFIKKTT